MILGHKALCKRATKYEQEERQKFQWDHAFFSGLQPLLLDVYSVMHPGPRDYELRKLLVQTFNIMVKDIFGSNNGFPVVVAFGSFTMDLFTPTSDLDLSINFCDDKAFEFPRERKISVLRRFARMLYSLQQRGHVSEVNPIMKARVPVVKAVDTGTGIECDISVENKDGISRSLIFAIVSSIDERFRILSSLMKIWAKVHAINSSKDRTMNSLTIISLVAFHLQTRDPPILPPFSTLFKDGVDIASVQNFAFGLQGFGHSNEESVAELFVTFMNKLSAVESLWQHGLCASTYEGSWISKTWNSGVSNMSVEDFLDRSENFARSVGKTEMQRICECIRNSLMSLLYFKRGQIDASKLRTCVFKTTDLRPTEQLIQNEGIQLKRKYPSHEFAAAPFEDTFAKRARYKEAAREQRSGHYEPPSGNPSLFHHPVNPEIPFHPAGHGNGLQHQKPPLFPLHLEAHATPQLGYGSGCHRHHPLLPQFGYGSLPEVVPPVALQSQHVSFESWRDRDLLPPWPCDARPQIPLPRLYNSNIVYPLHSYPPP